CARDGCGSTSCPYGYGLDSW
nr:immunoglobulin heavy chain junction region [Macaca mulatta]MOX91888.1 immunoglobulin heavy chain junction region [Macaca mulatta]MOX91985.1 immunoglobulin heavy chain junction region [Macaca mulatta]MOX92064.1 immunoglobulin heavy chain junction region [Macaca mulatta]MOX92100.1 immunoglobulin heavy chain junction region [Macaca mulatta]